MLLLFTNVINAHMYFKFTYLDIGTVLVHGQSVINPF